MAVTTVKFVVANPEQTLAVFNQLKIYRSTTSAQGPWLELTGPASRISLAAGQLIYAYTDSQGTPDSYYACTYYNSTTGLESSKSEPLRGNGDSALRIITAEELKQTFLFGLDLTDDSGNPMPDELFHFYIRSAVSMAETKLDMPIRQKIVVDERHTLFCDTMRQFWRLHLNHAPVSEVRGVSVTLPGGRPFAMPGPWLRLSRQSGVVEVTPQGGASLGLYPLGLVAPSGPWGLAMATADYIPDAISVDYIAGFADGEVPPDIRDYVGKMAAAGPLSIAGDLLGGAGVASQSVSLDGLSQSISNTGGGTSNKYSARLDSYQRDIDAQTISLRTRYKGLQMRVM